MFSYVLIMFVDNGSFFFVESIFSIGGFSSTTVLAAAGGVAGLIVLVLVITSITCVIKFRRRRNLARDSVDSGLDAESDESIKSCVSVKRARSGKTRGSGTAS